MKLMTKVIMSHVFRWNKVIVSLSSKYGYRYIMFAVAVSEL